MKKILEKIVEFGLYLYIFLLPLQTRWIWREDFLNGQYWEYGSLSLYTTDVVFVLIVLARLFVFPKMRDSRSLTRMSVVIGAFFLISFASTFWSVNNSVSWFAISRLLMGILLFWMLECSKLRWERINTALVSAGVIQAILGIYQFFAQQVAANKYFGMAAHSPDVLGDSVVETVGGRFLRAYGSFPHPNILAGFLVVCLIIIIGYLFKAYRNRSENIVCILFAVTSFVIICYGLILTFSRTAWVVLVLVLLILFIVSLWHRDQYRLRILAPVALWIALVVSFSVFLLPDLWQTRLMGGRLEEQSRVERISLYKNAFQIIGDEWHRGVGIGAYTQALYNQDNSYDVWEYQPVHNIFVLVTAETGVFGGLMFIFFVVEFFRASFWKHWRRLVTTSWFTAYSISFIALLLIGLFDHYLWSIASGITLFWLVLGLWARRYRYFYVDK